VSTAPTHPALGNVPGVPVAPRRLFAGLVDDASLFPPGNAPMAEALAEHARHRSAPYAGFVGPFVCPTSRVAELIETLPPGQLVAVSLVVDDGPAGTTESLRAARADERITLVAVEASHARLGHDAATVGATVRRMPSVTGYLEVDPDDLGLSLDLVAPSGGWQAAKYRTGGTTADAFPTAGELAAFLVACAERGRPFKLTAGLHHAVRHRGDDTGFEHHGLLNVLVATRAAVAGAGLAAITDLLDGHDAEPLVAAVSTWSDEDALAVRHLFRSVGCCGVTDPVDDLVALGLLAGTAA
jgi:hypothetical protein